MIVDHFNYNNALAEERSLELSASPNLAERAAELVQRSIVTGDIAPDTKLNIQKLVKQFNIGATPIREGLARLVGTGLVYAVDQAGFRTAPMSRADLEDLLFLRNMIELEGLRRSIAYSDDNWEAQIVLTLHRLNKVEVRLLEQADEGTGEFDAAHKAFHQALLSACRSPRLIALHSSLYDQAYRYRRAMVSHLQGKRPDNNQHQRLADLAMAHDVEGACALLKEHLAFTFNSVYGDEANSARSPDKSKRAARPAYATKSKQATAEDALKSAKKERLSRR